MKSKKKPNLQNIINDWLKKNRPKMYVEEGGSVGLIGLIEEKGKQSKMFGVLTYGYVYKDDVQLLNPDRKTAFSVEEMFITIKAADPEFFEKLAKLLPEE